MFHESFQRSGARRIRERLREVQNRAVAIRKRLSSARPRKRSVGRGVTDDAVHLAETIERLAHLGQKCSAEEAVEIASRVEVLASMLRVEVYSLSAS
jgi:hypothetical protein